MFVEPLLYYYLSIFSIHRSYRPYIGQCYYIFIISLLLGVAQKIAIILTEGPIFLEINRFSDYSSLLLFHISDYFCRSFFSLAFLSCILMLRLILLSVQLTYHYPYSYITLHIPSLLVNGAQRCWIHDVVLKRTCGLISSIIELIQIFIDETDILTRKERFLRQKFSKPCRDSVKSKDRFK